MTTAGADLETFIDRVGRRDERGALALALDTAAQTSAGEMMTALIVPALVAIAERTAGLPWSPSSEYSAANICDRIVVAVSALQPVGRRGHLVLACAEAEWHVLPARIASFLLNLVGWRTTFLGASLPAEHLTSYLRHHDATVAGVTCVVPANLPLVARTVEAVHDDGIPVILGGSAVTAWRARRLGADGWAAGALGAVPMMERWADRPPSPARPVAPPAAYVDLESDKRAIAEQTVGVLTQAPALAGVDGDALVEIEQLTEQAVSYACAAVYLDDPTVVADYLAPGAARGPSRTSL